MDNDLWDTVLHSKQWGNGFKGTAWSQLGTSGGGNHFVEWGILTVDSQNNALGLELGQYLSLLSHKAI